MENVTIHNSPPYSAEGVNYEDIDAKDPDTLTEVEKVALLGRPCMGEITKIQIRIRENKEFKVCEGNQSSYVCTFMKLLNRGQVRTFYPLRGCNDPGMAILLSP